MPGMEAGEDRVRVFEAHLADGAIFAPVDLLDEERAHCDVAEIGIELDCSFHFEFSFFCWFI
jgi:hypothetical protein